MRIWHEQLIPKLCQKHLCAMWREGLGAYAIITGTTQPKDIYSVITNNSKGYRNHPAVKEFECVPHQLWARLFMVFREMIRRGYHPSRMPTPPQSMVSQKTKEWQTLEEQTAILKSKKCKCDV